MTDHTSRAVASAVLAALVAVVAFLPRLPALAGLGETPLVVVVTLIALAIAVGWPAMLRTPDRIGAATVVALVAVGSVVTVTATHGHPYLRNLPVVVALGVLLAFVNELARRDGRPRVVDSVTGTVSGMVVAAAAVGWIAAGRGAGGVALVVAGAVALAAAAGVSAVPLDGWAGALATVVAGVAGGGAVAAVMPTLALAPGLLLGTAIGLLVAALAALVGSLPAAVSRWAAGAAVCLPVAASGFVVYVVGRVLLG